MELIPLIKNGVPFCEVSVTYLGHLGAFTDSPDDVLDGETPLTSPCLHSHFVAFFVSSEQGIRPERWLSRDQVELPFVHAVLSASAGHLTCLKYKPHFMTFGKKPTKPSQETPDEPK